MVKDRKLMAAIAALILLVIGLGFWAQANRQELRKNKTLLSVYRTIRKVSDVTYLPYFFRQDQVPVYEIEIDPRDIQKLDASLPQVGEGHAVLTDKVFVPAAFSYQGRTYDIEIRYRGDEPPHWVDPKKSYLVKFKKGERFQDMSRISFIIVDDRKFALEQFNNWRAKKLGLRVPESGFADLKINGKNHGLYFMIENWSVEMLAKWGAGKGSTLFGDTELPALPGGELAYDIWRDLETWKVAAGDEKNFAALEELLDLLNKSGDAEFYARIFNLIDQQNFYAWQVLQELMNSVHQNVGNVRLLYDAAQKKFFFIPWDVSSDPVENDNFGNYGALAARIFKKQEFLDEKNQLLRSYVSDPKNQEEDLAYYDATYEAMRVSLYKDRLKIFTNRYADKMHQIYRQEIIDNFFRLNAHLLR